MCGHTCKLTHPHIVTDGQTERQTDRQTQTDIHRYTHTCAHTHTQHALTQTHTHTNTRRHTGMCVRAGSYRGGVRVRWDHKPDVMMGYKVGAEGVAKSKTSGDHLPRLDQ